MANHLTCTWTGASGRKYVYDVHARRPALTLKTGGNFIYAKMDERRRWVPVLIGHGDLLQRAAADSACLECVDMKGATHVHVHVNADRDRRLAEEHDLLENFPQALHPDGCNKLNGG